MAGIAGRRYVEVLPDDCTCRAVNYSDYGGWYVAFRDDCPAHGFSDAPDRIEQSARTLTGSE